MPDLNQLKCAIELGRTGIPLKEYAVTYSNKRVECFICIPRDDTAFSVHLTSHDDLTSGLAMFVYIDGQYQCNRNSQNPRIDFRVRQKEELQSHDACFVGREWTFGSLKLAPAGTDPEVNHDFLQNLGTIEVLVLRCKSTGTQGGDDSETDIGAHDMSQAKFTTSGAARNASNSTPRHHRSEKASRSGKPVDEVQHNSRKTPQPATCKTATPAASENGMLGMFGLFDGAADSQAVSVHDEPTDHTPSAAYEDSMHFRHVSRHNSHARSVRGSRSVHNHFHFAPDIFAMAQLSSQEASRGASIAAAIHLLQSHGIPVGFDHPSLFPSRSGIRYAEEWQQNVIGKTGGAHVGVDVQSMSEGSRIFPTGYRSQLESASVNEAEKVSMKSGNSAIWEYRPMLASSEHGDEWGDMPSPSMASSARTSEPQRHSPRRKLHNDELSTSLDQHQRQLYTASSHRASSHRSTTLTSAILVPGVFSQDGNHDAIQEVTGNIDYGQWKAKQGTQLVENQANNPNDNVKPYWSKWQTDTKGYGSPDINHKYRSTASMAHRRDPYIAPAYELPMICSNFASSRGLEAQVKTGKGAKYVHKMSPVGGPEYIDSIESPYAVFTFKYRTKKVLGKMLSANVNDNLEDTRARIKTMSREELEQELLKHELRKSSDKSRSHDSGARSTRTSRTMAVNEKVKSWNDGNTVKQSPEREKIQDKYHHSKDKPVVKQDNNDRDDKAKDNKTVKGHQWSTRSQSKSNHSNASKNGKSATRDPTVEQMSDKGNADAAQAAAWNDTSGQNETEKAHGGWDMAPANKRKADDNGQAAGNNVAIANW